MTCVVRRLCAGLILITLAGASAAAAQAPAGGAAPAVPANARIAFVNARQVLVAMPGYAQAESLYAKDLRAAEAEGQRLQAAFDSAVAQFRQSQAMMTPTNRTTRERQLAAQQDSLEAKLGQLRERVGTRERELLAPIQQRLSAVIDGIRAEGNYWFVIDIGNQASQNIISFDPSLNITDRVLRRLQQPAN